MVLINQYSTMHPSVYCNVRFIWFHGQFPGNLRFSPLANKTRRGPLNAGHVSLLNAQLSLVPGIKDFFKISMGTSVVPTFRTLWKGECIEREGSRRSSPSHWAFVNFALLNLTPTTLSSSCSSFRCQHHKNSISSNHRCQSGQA
jgi:hypothetical protein